MPRFFIKKEQISDKNIIIKGDDAHHISRVLRMVKGDIVTLCDMLEYEYECVLESFGEIVTTKIVSSKKIDTEPNFKAFLFQALPKNDKLDIIIQKSVECGVFSITPFESKRCITHLKRDIETNKTERRQRIAQEAAKQCGRGIIPEVMATLDFDKMLEEAQKCNTVLFCYEGEGTLPLRQILKEECEDRNSSVNIAIIIGPEGGFTFDEAEKARKSGAKMTNLGKRILRTETAASFVLSCLVYEIEML